MKSGNFLRHFLPKGPSGKSLLTVFLFLYLLLPGHDIYHAWAGTSAPLRVSAWVKGHTEAKTEPLALEITVTPADTSKGYVEIKAAMRVEIRTNTPYIVDFEPLPAPFEGLLVSGMGNEFHIERTGGFITREPEGTREAKVYLLGFKFVLARDAVPGRYPITDLLNIGPWGP